MGLKFKIDMLSSSTADAYDCVLVTTTTEGAGYNVDEKLCWCVAALSWLLSSSFSERVVCVWLLEKLVCAPRVILILCSMCQSGCWFVARDIIFQ